MYRTVGLLDIPVELICQILSYLELRDLLHCTEINKHIRRVVLDSSRLQYTIELCMYGMVSILPLSKDPPLATRLQFLRDREEAWRALAWRGQQALTLPPTGSVYEFIGGIYANGKEDDRKVTSSISFFELPSSPDEPVKAWRHSMGDISVVDFTMDPAQDLIALVALAPPESQFMYEVHLHSIATNKPHPKASVTILPCLLKTPLGTAVNPEFDTTVKIQIAGDLIALLIKEVMNTPTAHLEIWHWESGPQFSCSLTRQTGIDDFAFLSCTSFLLVRPTGRFEVCTFRNPSEAAGSNVPISKASYALPPLLPGYAYWYISMSSNPSAGYVPAGGEGTSPAPAPAPAPNISSDSEDDSDKDKDKDDATPTPQAQPRSSNAMYYPRPDERIHACCLYITNLSEEGNHYVHSFVFFVNISTFLEHTTEDELCPSSPLASIWSEYIVTDDEEDTQETPMTSPSQVIQLLLPDGDPYANASPYYKTIPWDSWGPQNTRWFRERPSTDWQHALYGYRTVDTVPAPALRPKAYRVHAEPPDTDTQESELANAALAAYINTDTDEIDEFGEWSRHPGPAHRRIRVRDFNPYSVRRALNEKAEPPSSSPCPSLSRRRIVTEPSITSSFGVFENDIISSLPYVEVMSPRLEVVDGELRGGYDVTDAMMDDGRVLLLKRSILGGLRGIDVLTV